MGLLVDGFLQELGLVFVGCLVIFFFWLQKRYRFFEEIEVPYVKPTFLFGFSLRNITGTERLGETFDRLYKDLKGSRFGGAFQLFTPVYVIRDPGLIHRITVTDFSHFHSHGFSIDSETNPLEAHLINLDGEKWRTLRRKLSPTFTSGKLKWMFPQMGSCADAFLKVIEEENRKHKELEVTDLLARYTTDVIGSCAFGYEPEAIKDKDCKFRTMGRKIFSPSLKDVFILGLRMAFPKAFLRLKLKTVPDDVNHFFFSVVGQAFEHRKSTGEKRNDFLQLLLELREKGSVELDPRDADEEVEDIVNLDDDQKEPLKLELTDGLLTAQAFIFFGAGFETSANTMSFTIYYLSRHPEAQEIARKEVRDVVSRFGGEFTYDALKEMHYLEACLSEALRLEPPLEVHFRKCTKDYLLDGVLIEKGTSVFIPVRSLHRDPDFWDEPEEFKPERFLGGSQIIPGTYLPFGSGPRICIARRFAILESKLCLARILDSYSLSKSPKMKEPIAYNPRSFITQPLNGLWVHFQALKD